MSLMDLNSLVTMSHRNSKTKDISNYIINPDSKFIKFSTFNKHEDLGLHNSKKNFISSIGKNEAIKIKKLKKDSSKFERKSTNNLGKNMKFIRQLTSKNRPEDLYQSCYDTSRNIKKKGYYDDEKSLKIIQKNIQKKINALKNDNKFLESLDANNINISTILKFEDYNMLKENNENKNNSFSAKNIIFNYKKNENKKNENKKNIKNNSNNYQKLNNNSSEQKLSDDSSFLDDSSIIKKNKEKINKEKRNKEKINKEKINNYNKNLKNILNKERKYRILEIKKLVYDSFDDEEIIEDELLNEIYISPDNKFILILDYIIIILTLYSLIYIPINISSSICITKLQIQNILNYFMDLIYIIDLILSFLRPYYNFDEQLMTNNSKIILHYLYGYFFIDLICSIPFYSIFKIIERNKKKCFLINFSIKLNNLYRIFEILKALKLLKIMSKKRNSGIKI